MATDIDCVKAIRVFAADMVQKANSGHPGAPMGMAPMAHLLWSKVMNFDPAAPFWPNRDRFVLSNGHACALLYTMLHLNHYDQFPIEEIRRFRQLGSNCPGHPENYMHGKGAVGGIEVTTGPLGQGISNAVGLAIAQTHLAALFNKPGFPVVDNFTYVFTGDGCLQEGVASEACSLAGHLGLGRLIVLYDDNLITIDGATDVSFTEDVLKRYESYGWHTSRVADGDNDLAGISAAIKAAQEVTDKPSIIAVRTTIGVDTKVAGSAKAHGAPLGNEFLKEVKVKYGLDPEASFVIPEPVLAEYKKSVSERSVKHTQWAAMMKEYTEKFPAEAKEFERRISGKLPDGWEKSLPRFTPADPAQATRKFSEITLNALAKVVPDLVGGSADLTHSNLTWLNCSHDYQKTSPEGRYMRYGVREHGMAAIMNGMAAYGGVIPFGATFLNFIGYCWGAVILSALSHRRVIYIMTHDSIGLGEDGPTHQPINSNAMVRTLPNILLLRPADGNEMSGCYRMALLSDSRPSVIIGSRQNLPNLAGSSVEAVEQGAYILDEAEGEAPELILIGTGSETSLCVAAKKALTDLKVRVVSMPCWRLFNEQPLEYRKKVLLGTVPVMAVETGQALGWAEYAHATVGMTSFGASAPFNDVMKHFGFTTEQVAEKAREVVAFYKERAVPNLVERPFYPYPASHGPF